VKNRSFDYPALLEVLYDNSLEQGWSHRVIPHALRIDHDNRPSAADPKARCFTTFDSLRTEEKIFAVQQLS
jgi:hypothetical protein